MKSKVLTILEQNQSGISEFDLMKALDQMHFFEGLISEDKYHQDMAGHKEKENDLLLFHKHFMLMHVLYGLQDELITEERLLEISPLCIKIKNISRLNKNVTKKNKGLSLEEDEKLKAYYLDWDNYVSTTEENVKSMLNNFWVRFLYPENRGEAFSILELAPSSSQAEIKKRYRELAKIHHPDKGGNKKKFIEIQQAFETLKTKVNNS